MLIGTPAVLKNWSEISFDLIINNNIIPIVNEAKNVALWLHIFFRL